MYIYQDAEGKSLSRSAWEAKRHCKEWTLVEFRNPKIWISVEWIGRYDKKLPAEYRHSHAVFVRTRLITRKSEWEDEGTLEDKGWVEDIGATQTFRTKSAAMAAYEDLLLTYTSSYIEEDEDGEITLVEEGNELAPIMKELAIEVDEEQLEAASAKGIDIGGWS